ncbi:MerC domain-containing protein [Fodinibius roseus]|uniref:MerC domain-containing protein n=1 Tax=Fodinibius roseus TaxID=1194090 RepID=UPI00331379C6
MGLSGLCAIHCLLVPIFVSLLPLYPVAEYIHEWTHPVLLMLIIPAVYFSIRPGYEYNFITALLLSGLSILFLTWGLHDWLSQKEETWVTFLGSMLLIGGHWLNYKSHSARACSVAEEY